MDTAKAVYKEAGITDPREQIDIAEVHDCFTINELLTYEDLEVIADPGYWPFSRYWMWPARNQIEHKLPKTEGWLKNLPIDEVKIIRSLNDIFKNISLTSIVLRFARPDSYAIYSCPLLQILRIERGGNEVEDYLNLVKEMRILKDSFGVKKTSEVDQIIWAIFHLKGKYADELKKIIAKKLPGNLTAEEIILYLSSNPLKVAREYIKRKDHITAGLWASKAFEKFLDEECRKYGIYIEERPFKRSDMIKALCEQAQYWSTFRNKSLLYETKRIRNKIVPGVQQFTWEDVEEFIKDIETLYYLSPGRIC